MVGGDRPRKRVTISSTAPAGRHFPALWPSRTVVVAPLSNRMPRQGGDGLMNGLRRFHVG